MKKRGWLLALVLCLGLCVLAGCGGEETGELDVANYTQADLEKLIAQKGYDIKVTESGDVSGLTDGQVGKYFKLESNGVSGAFNLQKEADGLVLDFYASVDGLFKDKQQAEAALNIARLSGQAFDDQKTTAFFQRFDVYRENYNPPNKILIYKERIGNYIYYLETIVLEPDSDIYGICSIIMFTIWPDEVERQVRKESASNDEYQVVEVDCATLQLLIDRKATRKKERYKLRGRLENIHVDEYGNTCGNLVDDTGSLPVEFWGKTYFTEKELAKPMDYYLKSGFSRDLNTRKNNWMNQIENVVIE